MAGTILTLLVISLSLFVSDTTQQIIPDLTVKIGDIRRSVNTSQFDVSENEIVVDRGNTVQFICSGVSGVEWVYKDDLDQNTRCQVSYTLYLEVNILYQVHCQGYNNHQPPDSVQC